METALFGFPSSVRIFDLRPLQHKTRPAAVGIICSILSGTDKQLGGDFVANSARRHTWIWIRIILEPLLSLILAILKEYFFFFGGGGLSFAFSPIIWWDGEDHSYPPLSYLGHNNPAPSCSLFETSKKSVFLVERQLFGCRNAINWFEKIGTGIRTVPWSENGPLMYSKCETRSQQLPVKWFKSCDWKVCP